MAAAGASTASASLAQLEALCGAAARALSGDASLQWSAQVLYQGTQPVALPAAHQHDVPPQRDDQRALLDGAALRLRLSDAALHARSVPRDEVARLVFELLEQLRVESLAPAHWPGVQRNLTQRFERWAEAFVASGLVETDLGLLLFTLALSAWSRLGAHELRDEWADLMEATRANLMPTLGPAFAALRRHRAVQADFIPPALAISDWAARAVRDAQTAAGPAAGARARRGGFALPLVFEPPQVPPTPTAVGGSSRSWGASGQRYRVYTRAYDQELPATELVRAAQLAELRAGLDQDVAQAGLNLNRLVRHFRHSLATPQPDGWRFGQESGHIDGARLARLVASPHARAVFRDTRWAPVADCAVTVLLDCSGSMKAHAAATSVLVDVLARALDRAGVPCEVLGFSTGAWNGGRARRDWQRAGRPDLPGRLNETLNLVFKAAHQPWRQARAGIAALRRPDLFREGVDGEAVQWASQRLRAVPARRRILLVVSDGCPMDTATHQANDEHYLDQHLKQVLLQLQRQGEVRVCALGVGLDLGWFYGQRLAVDLQDGIGDALLQAVADLLAGRPPRRSPG